MKILLLSITVVVVLAGLAFTPVRSYSVREKINPTSESYTWEQWCNHESLLGITTREKLGTFELVGKNITSDSMLITDICD